MSKRAVIVITDAKSIEVVEWGETDGTWMGEMQPTEQLLADLRTLANPWNSSVDVLVAARAHLRSLLPKEGDKDENANG